MTERWFVGDHTDIGGRFAFESLDRDALANPPFRWIVWAAICAAGDFGDTYLLFKDRAFSKYFHILLYQGRTQEKIQEKKTLRIDLRNIITTDFLFRYPPSSDSEAAVTKHGRPEQEVFSTQLEVHNSFEPLSIWKTTQAFHGKGLHGNKRNHDDAILHASVKGKLAMAPSYGGKTRAQLDGLVADERIWGVFGVGPNLPIVFM